MGSENLHKPPIASRIAELVGERNERVKVEADWVLRRLVELAEADIADLFDGENNLRAPSDMPDAARRLLAGIEVDATAERPFVRKVRFIDRLKVLELIGKHIAVSAFRENVAHSTSDDLLERLENARRRVANR